LALDATAAVIAGGGTRQNTVSPSASVTTIEERDSMGEIPLVTLEHNRVFVIHHDATNMDGSYSAVIYTFSAKGIKHMPQPQRKEQPRPSFTPVLAA
jgi:hypothetical protein